MKTTFLMMLLAVSTTTAATETPSTYAGEQTREIKALSPERVAGLLAGAGLGLAKAAELNRYPGPMHVLELAADLGLSDEQVEATRALRAEVVSNAKALGAELVAAETELDALFRSGEASTSRVDELVQSIGALEARLRAVHLNAHVAQRDVLTAEQVERYVQLRGYGDSHDHHGHHRHHNHHH
ncbi:Spy/CpxP family protein refolding chaperone [Pseudofulvimonas gallinarii]|jgi:hypothetical protein|uniref:Signaling pathway modulator ZraP n=1 Tax=Pseudofulvimonas gallinarii TaxID=634155 RepID=A0A4R3LMC3_9GAMM|nr:periplasmic heavy metal sensor [Pseudofulvimonas gallinarii]TCT01462.1 heavy-metal resistance protein [Pseudofulvimonas gallinarii]